MESDDREYRKSVRNMSLVLAAIVLTVFGALALSPYFSPASAGFQPSASYTSPFGFTMHLTVNSTSPQTGGGILVTGWLNSSSGGIENITASSSWGLGPSGLWTKICTSGWPMGVGILRGYYTQYNVTAGTLIPPPAPAVQCPVQTSTPGYFLLESHSSRALVDLNGTPQYWVLQSAFSFSARQLAPGVYTALLADEWGDVLTTNFVVS